MVVLGGSVLADWVLNKRLSASRPTSTSREGNSDDRNLAQLSSSASLSSFYQY